MPKPIDPDTPILPVAGWDIIPLSDMRAILLRLHFVVHPLEGPASAQADRLHALDTRQARELAQKLLAQCDRMEAEPERRPPGTDPPH